MIDPFELRFALEQTFLRDRYEQIAVDDLIEKREIVNKRDLAHNLGGVETRIFGAIDHEAKKRLEVERVVRSSRDEDRVFVGTLAVAGGMARSAVIRYPRKADDFFRETDWQLLSLLPSNP